MNWIASHLQLDWIYEQTAIEQNITSDTEYRLPPKERMESLLNMINLGYMAGVRNHINEIDQQAEADQAFINKLKKMAESFDLDAMKQCVQSQLEVIENE
jgi:hypothetical protein